MRHVFTVFTPSYNRASTLPRVYENLKAQTFRDFEWLVVDDGSTDSTSDIVQGWQAEANFPIHYIYQLNHGKPAALRLLDRSGLMLASPLRDDYYASILRFANDSQNQVSA